MSANVAQLLAPFSTHQGQLAGLKSHPMNVKAASVRTGVRMKMSIGTSRIKMRNVGLGRVAGMGQVECNVGGGVVCRAGVEEVVQDVELGGGGEGGDGEDPPVLKDTGEEDKDGEGRAILMDALIKAGATLNDLPKDMQAAVHSVALTVDNIHQFLAISATPLVGGLCRAFPAFRDRVMGNPRFLLQVCLELGLGVTAKTVAEYQARGDKFFKEAPFVLSDLALEVLGDFSLVWLLSPKVSFKTPSTGIGSVISKLPGHCFQAGAYTFPQRAMTLVYRGGQFFCVGFGTSMIGHSLTKAAVERNAGPDEEVELAPVLDNSIGWGSFMALSSNTRYQTVNCIEENILDAFIPNKLVNIPVTFALRFTNCFIGGVQWVWFAKTLGLQ